MRGPRRSMMLVWAICAVTTALLPVQRAASATSSATDGLRRARVIHVAPGGTAYTLLVARNSERLVAMLHVEPENFGRYPVITVFDSRSGATVGTIRLPHGADPSTAAIDERRNRLLVGGFATRRSPGTVSSVDLRTLRIAWTKPVDAAGRLRFDFTPSVIVADSALGHAVVVSLSGLVTTLDVVTGKVLTSSQVAHSPTSAVVDASSHRAFVGSNGFPTHAQRTLAIIDTRTGRLLRRVVTVPVRSWDGKPGEFTAVLALDQKRGEVWVQTGQRLMLVSSRNGNTLHVTPSQGLGAISTVFSTVSRQMYVLAETGPLRVIDALSGKVIRTVDVRRSLPSVRFLDLDLSRDRILAVGGKGVVILRARTSTIMRVIRTDLAGKSNLISYAYDDRTCRLFAGTWTGAIAMLPLPCNRPSR